VNATATNTYAAVGVGKYRDPWGIRAFLSKRDLKMSDVARALKINHSVVSRTVSGQQNNRKVLAFLRDLGCPTSILSLPQNMTQQQLG
jgi:hypothetical protein